MRLYPVPSRRRPRARRRPSSHTHAFFDAVFNELERAPHKLAIVRANLAEFQSQPHLKRGLLKAVERFEWVFEVDDDLARIKAQVYADDFIGQRIRRYPMLFKGILPREQQ